MNEYNLCPRCGGVIPDRYEMVVRSATDPTPVLKPDAGPFPVCECQPTKKPDVVVTEVKDDK